MKDGPLFSTLLLAAFLHLPTETHGQWTETTSPGSGVDDVLSLAVIGGNLVAGTNGGLFLSSDNGASWGPARAPFPGSLILSLAVSPDSGGTGGRYLYAGTGNGVYLSTDGGVSWIPIGLEDHYVTSLAVVPDPGATGTTRVFAGTWNGVFRSTDNGSSWTLTGNGVLASVRALAVTLVPHESVGFNLFAGTNGAGVFRSTDDGISWSSVSTGMTAYYVFSLGVSPDSGGTRGVSVFAGTGNGLFRSTDNGTNWSRVDSGLTNNDVRSFALLPTGEGPPDIFVGVNAGGVFRSTDNGATWSPVNTGLIAPNTVPPSVFSLAVRPKSAGNGGSYLYAGTGNGRGVFLTTDRGTSWSSVGAGIATSINSLAMIGSNLVAATSAGRVTTSPNNGLTWVNADSGLFGASVWSFAVSGPSLFAGTGSGVLRSPNGRGWQNVSAGMTKTVVLALTGKGTNLFAGTWKKGVFLSTDSARSWNAVSTGLPNTAVWSLTVKPATGGSGDTAIFAGTGRSGVFRSTNNGSSWVEANSGLTDADIRCLAAMDTSVFAGSWGSGVFRSTNDGTTWNPCNTGLTNLEVVSFLVRDRNLFVGTNGGVFLSTDNGQSWSAVNTGLKNVQIRSLTRSNTTLFAGTTRAAVFSRPLAEVATSANLRGDEVPGTFVLEQNYPNPFNPTTVIRYQVPAPSGVEGPGVSRVRLVVYDLLGREVAVLADESKDAGVHEAIFDAAGLSNGVYFYRLRAGGFVQTRRMTVLK